MISRATQTALTRVHAALYRLTRGLVGGRLAGMEQVLLTTRGRVSGRPRTTPLSAIPHGGALVLVASDGGRPEHPQWYRNLLADDRVVVQRGSEHLRLRARVATPEEREALWPLVVATYDGYARYQARTQRQIPLVLCTPAGTVRSSSTTSDA